MFFKRRKNGFTIVELVIVIAVIAILAAVLIPTFSNVIRSARDAASLQEAQSTLKAYNSYTNSHGNLLNDGVVFKVGEGEDAQNYVYYEGELIKFSLDNKNDTFDVIDGVTTTPIKISGVTYYCDRYFCIPDSEGNPIKDTNGNTLYFCYSYQASIAEEMNNDEGTPVIFEDGSKKCKIYGGLVSTTLPESKIMNIIYMIPDGAGFGTYDLANMVKKQSPNYRGITNARTQTTTNAISGLTSTGLYLDNYMIASSDTSMAAPNGEDPITDSAAAGTALSSGYRTLYCSAGVDSTNTPRANLVELAQLSGKSTGVVTTKSWIDATPEAFMAHVNSRYQQELSSYQALYSNVDIMLAYGTDNGVNKSGVLYYKHNQQARDLGYTIVNNKDDLNREIFENNATRVWSNFTYGYDNASQGNDVSSYHISYDIDPRVSSDSEHYSVDSLTILDMTKAAIELLSNNINDKDGFFLMIEGGAIDNAAESRQALKAVGEYLAFDEAFAYCVNYAKNRRDTIVVASPDHDSGGFSTIAEDDDIIDRIIANDLVNDLNIYTLSVSGAVSGHSGQNVPVWFYGPDSVRDNFLTLLDLPLDASTEKVRTGKFYNGSEFNSNYTIRNCDIAPAVATLCGLMSFSEANDILFYDATSLGSYTIDTNTNQRKFTMTNGEIIYLNSNKYSLQENNEIHEFTIGRSLFIGVYTKDNKDPTVNYKIWLPKSFLKTQGYIQ